MWRSEHRAAVKSTLCASSDLQLCCFLNLFISLWSILHFNITEISLVSLPPHFVLLQTVNVFICIDPQTQTEAATLLNFRAVRSESGQTFFNIYNFKNLHKSKLISPLLSFIDN